MARPLPHEETGSGSLPAGRGVDNGHLEAAIAALPVGVVTIDAAGLVQLCNAEALALVGLPPDRPTRGCRLADIAAELADFSLAQTCGAGSALLALPGDRYLEVAAKPIAGGFVLLIDDMSEAYRRERALAQAESEYRSLFENSVYGIYRDTPDGKPVRANPALAALNGYASEAEHIAAVTERPGNWYVDPGRAAEFMRLIERDGRVKDLVSEVYRHRTGEKLWVTENAWYVRGPDGKPLHIEGTIQDAGERMANLSMIERQANRDSLTGAANRFHFLNRAAEETAPQRAGCVLYLVDLDHFKDVNDLLGHAAGDAVLKTVAQRLQALAGGKALVARLGGDEFAVLATGTRAFMEADILARRMVEAMRQPISVAGHDVNIGASVGVAFYPLHAHDANELLSNADIALYQAKTAGRNGIRIFDYELKSRLQSSKELANDLRRAVADDELDLFYQPIVEADTGAVRSYETLLRWHHPKRGFLPPDQFIPVAESAGLMSELGNWAIARACRQAVLLPGTVSISINVSPSQFRSAEIIGVIRDNLHETGLDPARLMLEVTETALLASEAIAQSIFDQLIGLGVRIALDDFGTGFSSLSYLQRFAFSEVKIDRSFIAGIEASSANLAIIRAVIGLGRDLDIDVVAEGVETAEQAAVLRHEGCRLIQGYHFGRPRCFADIVADRSVLSLAPFRREAFQVDLPAKRSVHKAG
ncbi:MAG: EAL domain-containing protein [Rhizobiales bacterium]|nr:EAL domain-containing protein [Hyphomicrobiales bacterium]